VFPCHELGQSSLGNGPAPVTVTGSGIEAGPPCLELGLLDIEPSGLEIGPTILEIGYTLLDIRLHWPWRKVLKPGIPV
jgi:hypothetical protein